MWTFLLLTVKYVLCCSSLLAKGIDEKKLSQKTWYPLCIRSAADKRSHTTSVPQVLPSLLGQNVGLGICSFVWCIRSQPHTEPRTLCHIWLISTEYIVALHYVPWSPSRSHPHSSLFGTKCLLMAKSRKYQGVFEVKSRVKIWQVRGIWSQQLEH